MNIVLAVNEKTIEKYVSSMKECNVLKVVKNKKNLVKETIEYNPHVVLISNSLPGKELVEEVIFKLREEQPHTRIIYLYGADDSVRKKFTNFLIENGVYDFHVGAIDEDVLNELILSPKSKNDVQLEDLTLDEQNEIEEQERLKKEYLEELRKTLRNQVEEVVSPGDTLTEEEIEEKVEEEVVKKVSKELEVHIIERIEEVEKVVEVEKVITEKVIETKLIKQQTYAVLSLYNTTIKDFFISNLTNILSNKCKEKILIIDFETPYPTLDHHFNIDKNIYMSEVHSSKALTGVLGCISAIKKNVFNIQTFNQFVKEIKGYNDLYILTGLYDIDEFDRLDLSSIEMIINCAKELYDIVIISCNSFPLNSLTYTSIVNSNKVLLVSEPTYVNGRANIEFIKEFTEHQKQNKDKFNIVMWGELLNKETVAKLYEGYNVLGTIRDNTKYLNSLVTKEVLTKNVANKKDMEGYLEILKNLGYVPKQSLFNRIFKRDSSLAKSKEVIEWE